MRPLLMLWSCLVLPGYGSVVDPKEISGFEGDTVSLQCTYGEELKEHPKYWCREVGIFISRCAETVFAGGYGQEGRVSVHDNRRENRFTVILRNLTLKDMGKYLCGVKRLGFDKTASVSLLVFPGSFHLVHRVSIPLIRILAPVLVLLALLLATGLAALGSCMFQWREKAQLASETQKKDKVHLSHLALGNSWVPESAVIKLAEPTGPPTSPKPSASSNTEIWCLSQTSEDDEASSRHPEGDMTPASTLPMSGDEPGFSKFSSV
ncbi:CMRF35-like molecule 9 isoform X7 [Moschus berezovskii]|uniref:CMRF35-like molecule 9 isoform X7 n=1 Tax=Moschus berezovskii TaxID=68408 RepID=UPI0024443129|nr:CMRF35-like molecule 9 isoform X7 [Moschus berezovskii]